MNGSDVRILHLNRGQILIDESAKQCAVAVSHGALSDVNLLMVLASWETTETRNSVEFNVCVYEGTLQG